MRQFVPVWQSFSRWQTRNLKLGHTISAGNLDKIFPETGDLTKFHDKSDENQMENE